MGFDPVLPADIGGAGGEFVLHDTEVFFDLPTLLIDPDDLADIPFQVGYDCVEAIIHRFFFNLFPVKFIHAFLAISPSAVTVVRFTKRIGSLDFSCSLFPW